jgi:hypothetical protein
MKIVLALSQTQAFQALGTKFWDKVIMPGEQIRYSSVNFLSLASSMEPDWKISPHGSAPQTNLRLCQIFTHNKTIGGIIEHRLYLPKI